MFGGRFSNSIGLVGIDFGAGGARLLQLRKQGSAFDVVGAGHVEVSLSKLFDADRSDHSEHSISVESSLRDGLKAAFTQGGFVGRKCAICLPRQHMHVQSVRLPRMPDTELRDAAAWEASQRFGFDRGAMEADFIRSGASPQGGENREEVIVIASPHKAINPIINSVMDAGLRPVAIDTDFAALARTHSLHYRRDSDQKHVRALLEVGKSGSTIMILRGDQIAFCKPIPVGGADFDEAVADNLQLDGDAVVSLRRSRLQGATSDGTRDASIDPSTDRAVFEAVRPFLHDLVKEVTLCLRYYSVTFRGHPPVHLILAGGNAREPRLADMIQETCKLNVVYDDQHSTLAAVAKGVRELLGRSDGSPESWAVAAGLSLRGISQPTRQSADQVELDEGRRGAA